MNAYKKYPKTFHLPWSLGKTNDDKTLKNVEHFLGKKVVVTEKMDGENTSIYFNHVHARSIDSKSHPSRNKVKALQGKIGHLIPTGYRLCGENVYAKHSIFYKELPRDFLLFSVWNEENVCLSWEETLKWANLLNLSTVPVLYEGVFDEKIIKSLYTKKSAFGGEQEGYVVRLYDSFSYEDFSLSCAKFVRENHVQTDKHWIHQSLTPNGVIKPKEETP